MTEIQNRPDVMVRHADRHYINGAWTVAKVGWQVELSDCFTQRRVQSFAEATPQDIARAVEAAREAFDHGPWPRLSPEQRAEYLTRIADGIDARAGDLSAFWSIESGFVHRAATAFTELSSGIFRSHADMASQFAWEERHTPTMGGAAGFLVREPVGVVGAILPWNAPLVASAHKLAPALLAGCTVVLKASPGAPGEAWVLAEIAHDIGLPPGVLNVVVAGRDATETLVADPRVDKIAFTGPTAVGKRIASIAGGRIGRVSLGLGGKSAAVLLDDADISMVAEDLAGNVCLGAGQLSAAVTRVLVPQSRHTAVVEALTESLGSIKAGDPFDPDTMMGPLAGPRQRLHVENHIARGVADGARLVLGGGRPTDQATGYFIEPTIFDLEDNSLGLAQQEVFGPVLSVIPYDSERQAVEMANDTVYGLNAAVFTADADRAYGLARRLRSGTVGHNATRMDYGIAFGGFKRSGVGREGGREGLVTYTEAKTVILDSQRSDS